jgi:hypothetical protein
VNTYRLYLFGRDGAVAQVSEIECPDDGFAVAFATERRRDFAKAELWRGDRMVVRLEDRAAGADAIVVPSGPGAPVIGTA